MAGPQSAPTAGYDNFEIARRLWIGASHMGRIDADDELPQRIVRHAEFELLALAGDWWNVRPLPEQIVFPGARNRQRSLPRLRQDNRKIQGVRLAAEATRGIGFYKFF